MFYFTLFFGVISSIFNSKRKITFFIFGILLILLAFFRYGVGADYFNYMYLYERLSTSLQTELFYGIDNQEIGFRLLGTLFRSIDVPYQIYISIIAFIHLIFIMKICNKYSPNPAASLLLFFCFYYFVWTFSGLRQGLTLAIGVFYLLKCIEQNKGIKLIIISFILSFIHLSSLILIPLYYASRIKWKKAHLIIISTFSVIISLVPSQVIAGLISYFPFSNRLIPYIEINNSIINNIDFQTVGRIFFLLIAFIFYDGISNHSTMMKKILNVFILSLSVYFLFKFSELTAARLSVYGKLLDIIILPSVYYVIKNRKGRMLYSFFIFILLLVFFGKELEAMVNQAAMIQSYDTFLVPYSNIFNKDEFSFDKYLYQFID